MKILMLTASLSSGGAETHIFELASALSERGHEIVVASSGGEIAKRLTDKKIRHVCLPLNSKRPIRLIYSLARLRRMIAEGDFDVIHVHSRIAALLCRLSLPKSDRPTVVSTVHAHFKVSPLLRRLSFWGQASVAVSEDLREYLCEEYLVPKDEVRVIPNAIDTERFSSCPERSSKKTPVILFASRLDSDCSLGATLLCRIAPRLAKRYSGVKILIAGGGKSLSRISATARRVNEGLGYECIKPLGQVSDMPSLFTSADIFVGVSRAALEAMSCCLPVILCGNEGFMGIVDSKNVNEAEKTNFCCRGSELPDSINLFESVSALLDMSPADRRRLGEHLREHVCRHHAPLALAEHTEEFYNDALKKRPKIILSGYYGFDNLGDDTLLGEAIKELKARYPHCRIKVICHAPRKTAKKFGVRTERRENIPRLFSEIRSADRLVLGGGSILQDSTSMRSLRFYTMLINAASRHNVPVELLSNGLGPLKRRRARRLAARALSKCEKISLRDERSIALALSLGIERAKLALADDLSSRVSECETEKLCRLLESNGLYGKSFFLIAIRGKTRRSERRLIEGEIKVQTTLGLSPVFVVMHKDEDKKISRKLKAIRRPLP